VVIVLATAIQARDKAGGSTGPLSEHPGSQCRKCFRTYTSCVAKCPRCGQATEPAKWYSRFRAERVVFIITLALLTQLPVLLVPLPWFVGLIFAGVIPVMYFFVYYLLGFGGLTQRFPEDSVPMRARGRFPWLTYVTEFFWFFLVYCAFGVLMSGLAVVLLLLKPLQRSPEGASIVSGKTSPRCAAGDSPPAVAAAGPVAFTGHTADHADLPPSVAAPEGGKHPSATTESVPAREPAAGSTGRRSEPYDSLVSCGRCGRRVAPQANCPLCGETLRPWPCAHSGWKPTPGNLSATLRGMAPPKRRWSLARFRAPGPAK
jgi:hypothetical protein